MRGTPDGRTVVRLRPAPRKDPPSMFFTKVIAGDDGRDGGRDALALARAIAPGAELVLASAYPWDATPSRYLQAGYGDLLRRDTEETLARRRDEAGLSDARLVAIADSSAAHALHRLAEAEGAGLLVIGSSRRGPVGRMLLGDVARSVLHGAPCPVAVAPQDLAAASPATIGVAYDRSPEAAAAVAVAAGLAGTLGARLQLREVVGADLLPAIGGLPLAGMDQLEHDLVAEAQERLDAMLAELPGRVPGTAEAVSGLVAEQLDELAAGVDLLVCGSRGWGTVRRVVLGSTADRLIHHAPCPVLVVPRTAEADDRVGG